MRNHFWAPILYQLSVCIKEKERKSEKKGLMFNPMCPVKLALQLLLLHKMSTQIIFTYEL